LRRRRSPEMWTESFGLLAAKYCTTSAEPCRAVEFEPTANSPQTSPRRPSAAPLKTIGTIGAETLTRMGDYGPGPATEARLWARDLFTIRELWAKGLTTRIVPNELRPPLHCAAALRLLPMPSRLLPAPARISPLAGDSGGRPSRPFQLSVFQKKKSTAKSLNCCTRHLPKKSNSSSSSRSDR